MRASCHRRLSGEDVHLEASVQLITDGPYRNPYTGYYSSVLGTYYFYLPLERLEGNALFARELSLGKVSFIVSM
jgi:hypothetical protein